METMSFGQAKKKKRKKKKKKKKVFFFTGLHKISFLP